MKIDIIICVPAQILYLGNIVFLRSKIWTKMLSANQFAGF